MAGNEETNILLEAILLKLCEIGLVLERDKKHQLGILPVIREKDGVYEAAKELQESRLSVLKD